MMNTALADAEAISTSLERVAERCGDPTPLVYARLFAQNPQMEPLFVRDTDGAVRGQMLYQVLESLLDFSGAGAYGGEIIAAAFVNEFADWNKQQACATAGRRNC